MIRYFSFLYILFLLYSCNNGTDRIRPVTPEERVANDIASLKEEAQPCDLILRAGDDLLSQQIRFLNESDRSYSHAGIIFKKNGEMMVCDIYPHENTADSIEFLPVDSFINPAKNIQCALYRYNLSAPEKDSLVKTIEQYRENHIRFDKYYDLATDDALYCSEMIAKALKRATNNRIVCKEVNIPERMRPLLTAYFKKLGGTEKIISERKYIAPDNLYLLPECKLVKKFPLKYFPGS